MSGEILKALDVNAEHSGDPIARAYFSQAAAAIRKAEWAAEHWRSSASIEREANHQLRKDNRQLQAAVDRLIAESANDTSHAD
ncbi:hypothetical protein [Sphingobium cupriresistens]|uniref:Uncharacterized protein n=1 Tax=Sphingobium cupriresistens TaxID=1132417 RepID=A0A8G1ZJ94_9SPHN|nr:hypothetical protein [Sphingobium cupriresistens]RYM08005.1 hypothetical protein EWH12_17880 [Sphingobium cupriresistens]